MQVMLQQPMYGAGLQSGNGGPVSSAAALGATAPYAGIDIHADHATSRLHGLRHLSPTSKHLRKEQKNS